MSRPNPCRKRRIASGSEYSLKGESYVSALAAITGSEGTSKGSRTSARADRASPGTSTPSQKERVPSKMALSADLKLSSKACRDTPLLCSSTRIPLELSFGEIAAAVLLRCSLEVNSAKVYTLVLIGGADHPAVAGSLLAPEVYEFRSYYAILNFLRRLGE